eukprot:295309_1
MSAVLRPKSCGIIRKFMHWHTFPRYFSNNKIETADNAVLSAQKEVSSMVDKEIDKFNPLQKLTLASRILAANGHGNTLSGQITLRDVDNNGNLLMWVNCYGKPLELLKETDFILVNKDMDVIKGNGFPNRATRFHYHVYLNRQNIKCLIHTHPPKTSALSMTGKPLYIGHMDSMCFYNDTQYLHKWPGIPFGDEEGEIISNVLKDKWSALLAHHGLIVGGETIEQTTYRAFWFEKAAEMQLDALSAVGGDENKLPKVDHELAEKAREWRISDGPTKAHFNCWANMILNNNANLFS